MVLRMAVALLPVCVAVSLITWRLRCTVGSCVGNPGTNPVHLQVMQCQHCFSGCMAVVRCSAACYVSVAREAVKLHHPGAITCETTSKDLQAALLHAFVAHAMGAGISEHAFACMSSPE